MHHGEQPFEPTLISDSAKELAEKLSAFNARLGAGAFGATQRFPEGKLRPDDEGEIRFGVTVNDGKVIISFGPKPISWIGMGREQANELADVLRQRATEIK